MDWWLRSSMSIVINTELCTWNRWIVRYVNCGSIQLRYEKKGKKRGTPLLNSVHSKTGTASFSAESDHCCEAVGPRLHAGRARVPASNLTLSLSCSGSSGWGSSTRKGSQFPLIRLWALALQPPVIPFPRPSRPCSCHTLFLAPTWGIPV